MYNVYKYDQEVKRQTSLTSLEGSDYSKRKQKSKKETSKNRP